MSRRKKRDNDTPPRNPNGTSAAVRPVSRNTGFNKLRAISCFPEVHDRICKGWPLSDTAKYIQEECGEYTDAVHATLVKVLQNYRDSIPPGERAKYALPKAHRDAIAEVEEDIDEVKELIKLYRRQEQRMDIDGKVEKSIGKLLPTMTQEVRATAEILNRIAQIKMDLGVNERHLGTVDVEANLIAGVDQKYAGTDVSTVLSDPKKRRRLLSIAEHAMAISKKNVYVEAEEEDEPEGVLVSIDD